MKKNNFLHALVCTPLLLCLAGCSGSRKNAGIDEKKSVAVTIDLQNVVNDKVAVDIKTPVLTGSSVQFSFPKVIPGTYAVADYGRYIEGFEALNEKGEALQVTQSDVNTWTISDATRLSRIKYLVNDTYDTEGGSTFEEGSKTIFSPAGTNILAGKNFVLNMCGFIGYFKTASEYNYVVDIKHPASLTGVTALVDKNKAEDMDRYMVKRYAELVDHPIMYAAPDISSAKIGDMEVILSVYSPRNKKITSAAFFPDLTRMIKAQKNYLGSINNTKKYAVLSYITTNEKDDAKGIGALEHNTSTSAVFMETMRSKDLVHVISHEFFHTLVPLKVHSEEIHYFDFSDPKMSAHLWMYEGLTEYFANHFQVHEGLMSEDVFLAKMSEKEILSKKSFNDSASFTNMSKNVLDPKMRAQYPNVYQKGALMAMCLDIMLREASAGKKGILHLMGELSKKYGADKPFKDPDLIPEITQMTNPEIGKFLQEHIVNGAPIDYEFYLKKVGVQRATVKIPTLLPLLGEGNKPYIKVDTVSKQTIAVIKDDKNAFLNDLGVMDGDQILELNDIPLNSSNPSSVLMVAYGIEEGEPVTMKVIRNGKTLELKSNAKLNYVDGNGYKFTDESKRALKDAWLKG